MKWLAVLFLIFLPLIASAIASVTLFWNRSVGTNIAGYKAYWGGSSRTYTNVVNAGNTTNVTISGLIEGRTYFFAATAYNTSGLESDYSAEISNTVPTVPGPARPRLSVARLDKSHVLVSWPTNFPGYKLAWSTDLRTWTLFSPSPVLSGTNWTFVDSTACCPNWWFYRLQK